MTTPKQRATCRPRQALIPATAACSLILAGNALAWGGCEHKRVIEEDMSLGGSETLSVTAAAGDLDIRGDGASGRVGVRATVCASKAEWAEETRLAMSSGSSPEIAVVTPDTSGLMSWGNQYVYVDLELTVPEGLGLQVRDSSGDMEISGAGAVSVKDSSGDIEVRDTRSVVLEDSSGDIEIDRISGDVTVVQDSSGDIRGRDIGGSVIVARDSSGDIRFESVEGDFLVERDSSGDVVARTIGGDFAVLRDGSGEIRHSDVQGEVQVPETR
jgi:hypothetical protein